MKPRPILPNTTYMITRRCTQRERWLVPSDLVNAIVRFCVATAASKFGVKIHACCFMSNHWHCVLTDEQGRLPDFTHWVHLFIGKCINKAFSREETLWSSDEPCYEELCDDGAALGAIVYCVTNPVAAGLVETHREWPGWCSSPTDWIEESATQARPEVYFGPRSPTDEEIPLALVRPPIFLELSDRQLAANVSDCIAARESRLALDHDSFAGAAAVRNQTRGSRPDGPTKELSLRPRFRASCKIALDAAIERFEKFYDEYSCARRSFKEGNRAVRWPPGTWAMRRIANVCVAEPG